jgi:HrpA-like RNA helicase
MSTNHGPSNLEPDEEVEIKLEAGKLYYYTEPTSNFNMENPYLAHRTVSMNSVSGVVHPLHGWIPRKVSAEQVRKAIDGHVNPFTKQSVSAQYKKIMETRKKLPVYGYMDEFYKIVSPSDLRCFDKVMY